jgi:hypothetical protein
MLQGRPLNLDTVCRFGGEHSALPVQLVWGDSHAAALVPAIRDEAERYGTPTALASLSGCLPLFGAEGRRECRVFNQQALALVQQQSIRDVILAARWSLYLYGDEFGDMKYALAQPGHRSDPLYAQQRFAEGLRRTVASLRAAGARVWLFKEVPMQRLGTLARLGSLSMMGRSTQEVGRPIADHIERQQFISALFAEIAATDPQIRLIDPAPLLCQDGLCHAQRDGWSLYRDENHLSDQGAERMRSLFEPVFISENAH